jgi:hypothetical protein
MPFCSNCGSQVTEGHKFCNNCGAPLNASAPQQQRAASPQQQPQAQPNYQPQPTPLGERVIGMIEQCKYGFPVNTFTLFMTDRRIIVAKTGGLGANFASAGVASGGIVGGLIGAGLDARSAGGMSKKTAEYYAMTPDMMLTKDKKNFDIHYASVQSVEMKQPGFMGQGEIKFKTTGKDKRFILTVSKEIFSPYIAILQQALPDRVFLK